MTERYAVSRVIGSELVRVGTLLRSVRGQERFSYAGSYLERGEAPLSLSLPLRSEDYAANDIRPYFDGLLPEGPTRTAIVARLQVPETDWLAILGSSGLDCIGDVVVEPEDPEAPDVRRWNRGAYVPLGSRELCDVVSDLSTLAKSSEESRLSLAGSQGKVGVMKALTAMGRDLGYDVRTSMQRHPKVFWRFERASGLIGKIEIDTDSGGVSGIPTRRYDAREAGLLVLGELVGRL